MAFLTLSEIMLGGQSCLPTFGYLFVLLSRAPEPTLVMISLTMGDGSLICPVQVNKTIPPPPGVSWVSRDQKLNVEHRYIGFMLILSVNIVKSWKIGIFWNIFEIFHWF